MLLLQKWQSTLLSCEAYPPDGGQYIYKAVGQK